MKCGNFVISGAMWRKFNANRPWMTFVEFWMFKEEHAYNRCNAQSKHFFDRFTHDADKHHEVLRDRTIRCEIKHMINTDVPYLQLARLLEPKPEPVEELHGDYCFMYKEGDAFVQGN